MGRMDIGCGIWERNRENGVRRTSLTMVLVSVVLNAFLSSLLLASSPLETFTNTFAIWRTSSMSVSTPLRHSCTLFL